MLVRPKFSFYRKNALNDMKGFKLRLIISNVLPLLCMFLILLAISNITTYNIVIKSSNNYIEILKESYNNEIKQSVGGIIEFLDYDYSQIKNGTLTKASAISHVKSYLFNLNKAADNKKEYWIIEPNGNIVVSPLTDSASINNLSNKDYKKYLDKIQEIKDSKEGFGYATFKYTAKNNKTTYNKTTYFYYYEPYNWIISTSYNQNELNKEINTYTKETKKEISQTNMTSFIAGIIVFFIASISTSYMGISITSWIKELKELSDTMKTGVLTNRLKLDFKHELRDTSNAINQVQDNFVELITQIDDTANKLNDSVNTFTENHLKMNSSIDSVSHSVYEITDNINKQTLATSNVSASIDDISHNIQNTSREIDTLTDNSKSMQDYSEKSMTSLNKLLTINERTKQDIKEMYEQTMNTNESVEKISKAAELINQIASQTNLLSLNDSIEAARAGENGKGFAVVASEIGNLASQSSATVKEISSLLEELTTNSSKSFEVVKEMTNDSAIQNTTILETNELFNNLTERLNICIDSIKSIFSHIQLVNQKKDNILVNLAELNDISASNAASTEETAAMSEELTDMVARSSANIQELAKEFTSLTDSINKFTFK